MLKMRRYFWKKDNTYGTVGCFTKSKNCNLTKKLQKF